MEQYVLNTTTYGTYAHSHEFLLVAGEGFEPSKAEPGDLQSPPIGRSGNPPRSNVLRRVKITSIYSVEVNQQR